MTGIKTPAMLSLESGEIMSEYANQQANDALLKEGIDPLEAFVDSEVQRHHRALALQADEKFRNYIHKCIEMEGSE